MTVLQFAIDLNRVREIAAIRVARFDAEDRSFSSIDSGELFQEYRRLREHYGQNTKAALALKAEYDRVWES